MGISWNWLLKILLGVVGPLMGLISPAIKDALFAFLAKLYLDALKTENPWDDYAVGFLLDLLGIPRPSPP